MIHSELEAAALNLLRPTFEKQGYEVLDAIPRDILPSNLRGYIPDAVMKKDDKFKAFEFKRSRNASITKQLQKIAEKFETTPNWTFEVYYLDELSLPEGPRVQENETILATLGETSKLLDSGNYNAAFLMSWAAFEAVSRNKRPDLFVKPQSPGRIIAVLAENGDLSPRDAEKARTLVPKRNSLIHGELNATISEEDVKAMLSIIFEILKIEPTA